MTTLENTNVVLRLRKYPNRRIYNPETSHYITSEGIFKEIYNGRRVVVLDKVTEEDITIHVLLGFIATRPEMVSFLYTSSDLHDKIGDFLRRL